MEQNKSEMEKSQLLTELLRNPEDHAQEIDDINKMKPTQEPWGFEIPYTEYPKYYAWDNKKRKWNRRKRKVI